MPTTSEYGNTLSHEALINFNTWTNVLKNCSLTGIGSSINQIYRRDGLRSQLRQQQETCFHLLLDEEHGIFIYGILEGLNSMDCAKFVQSDLPYEIGFVASLKSSWSDEQIESTYRESFLNTEREYFISKSEKLALRTSYNYQLEELGDNRTDDYLSFTLKLQQLNDQINSGSAVVTALLVQDRLFVANLGNCRALLCVRDENGHYKAIQFTKEHNLKNTDEIERLRKLGLNVDQLKADQTGILRVTRCIGGYFVKNGYKENPLLKNAQSEPVIAEPEITSYVIDEKAQFLLLFSDGLYNALADVRDRDQVNSDIVEMVIDEFGKSSTLTSVAQSVVNRICCLHQDQFLSGKSRIDSVDDMTLMIRLFHYPWHKSSIMSDSIAGNSNLGEALSINCGDGWPEISADETRYAFEEFANRNNDNGENNGDDDDDNLFVYETLPKQFDKDENGEIQAYVDFDDFNKALEEAEKEGISLPEITSGNKES